MTKNLQAGFTLIELIIFIVIVGAGLAGILSVMTNTVKSSADPMVRKQSLALAESLLEEIVLKDYAVGGYSGTDRAQFDDVRDYHGYATSGGIQEVFNMAGATVGALVPGLGSYNYAPAVEVSSAASLGSGAASVPVLSIKVSVTGPGGTVSLQGFRAP